MHVEVTSRELLYHIRWKVRLRRFFEGKEHISEEEVDPEEQCSFEKWLYSPKTTQYISGDTIGQLARLHVEFHSAAQRMHHRVISDDRNAARKELMCIDSIHAKLFALLVAMRAASMN